METPPPNLKLVDVADPPIPTRITRTSDLTTLEVMHRVALPLVAGIVFALSAWSCFQRGATFAGVALGFLALVSILVGVAARQSVAAPCPYCGEKIFNLPRKHESESQEVQCGKCYEYSTLNQGLLRALNPGSFSPLPKFISPVYRTNIWPRACVACGALPTRYATISKTGASTVQFFLTAGRQFTREGEVTGIPYCDQHQDSVKLKFRQSNKMLLQWCSLRIMRRYLAANRNASMR